MPAALAALTFAALLLLWPSDVRTGAAPAAAPTGPAAAQNVEAPDWGDEAPLEATAEPEPPGDGRIDGTVTDERGGRVANAPVSARAIGSFVASAKHTRTDSRGSFTFGELHGGTWELIAAVRPAGIVSALVELDGGMAARVELAQPRLGTIRGVVRAAGGRPLRGEAVRAVCGKVEPFAQTDATGRYTMPAVPVGASCRVARAVDFWKADGGTWVTVNDVAVEVDFTIGNVALIKGRVLDEEGAPFKTLEVGPRPWAYHPPPDGRLELDSRTAPRWVGAAGKATFPLPEVPVDGPDLDLGTIVLREGRSVTGVVRDGLGAPVPFASLTVLPAGRTRRAGIEGRFRLFELPKEEVRIAVKHEGYETLTTTFPEGSTEVELTLKRAPAPPKGETLRGRILWPRGRVEIPIIVRGGGRAVEVDARDEFVLEDVRPGPVTLTFAQTGRGKLHLPPMSTTVEPGVEAHVEARAIPLSGKAVVLFQQPLPERPPVAIEVDGEVLDADASWNTTLVECRLTNLPLGAITLRVPGRPPVPLEVTAGTVARATVP